jgi:hypothetical protein
MSGSSSSGKAYVNTLVFSIVSALVALGLLILLIWGPSRVRDFAFLIVTVELGLVAVMLASVVRIWLYERSLKEADKNKMTNIVMVDTCPDYWTARHTPTGKICENTYNAPRDADVQYSVSADSSVRQINLDALGKQKLPAVCSKVRSSYDKVAWVDLRSACDSYGMYSAASSS